MPVFSVPSEGILIEAVTKEIATAWMKKHHGLAARSIQRVPNEQLLQLLASGIRPQRAHCTPAIRALIEKQREEANGRRW